MTWIKKPAVVHYIGVSNDRFTTRNLYEAYFLEYWQGKRNSLHVSDNSGKVTDFNPFEDFEIVSDEENLLNTYEAIVRCISHNYDGLTGGLTYNQEYKAIGRDKDGMYLVMDDSYDCYFYPSNVFVIIDDRFEILSHRSVYYSYHNKNDEIIKC